MAGRQAKILSGEQIEILLAYAAATRHPDRNRVNVLLSVKAGLRASEIANVTWDMVVDPTRAVGSVLELRDHAAKNKSGRTIPLHSDLRAALIAWRDKTGAVVGPIIASDRGTRMTSMSIVNWFAAAFHGWATRKLVPLRPPNVHHQGGAGCASSGGSLRDVQLLAGALTPLQMTQDAISMATPTPNANWWLSSEPD